MASSRPRDPEDDSSSDSDDENDVLQYTARHFVSDPSDAAPVSENRSDAFTLLLQLIPPPALAANHRGLV